MTGFGDYVHKDWFELTRMVNDEEIVVEKVSIPKNGISISGSFDLPPLSKLPMEEQVFIAAFVKCHGSIKQMENIFGISYPTVKNRLNRISKKLDFVEITPIEESSTVLDRLERGEISAKDAIENLKKQGA